MKKLIIVILTFALFFFVCPVVYAQEESDDFSQIKEEMENSLKSAADEDTKDILDKNGISVDSPENIGKINPEEIINNMWEYFKTQLYKPVKMLGKIIAAAIMGMIIQMMNPSKGTMGRLFDTLCVLTVIIVISHSLSESFENIKNSLEDIKCFMTAYIPVYAGTIAAGGGTVTAGSYSTMTIFLCEVISVVAGKILIPFLSVVLAFTLVSAINPQFRLSDAANTINKFVVWTLGAVTSLFVMLLSIQGMTGSAVDTKAAKVMKFAASSFIPVIGSSVSDAYSAVKGSLGLIKTGVGVFGTAVIFIIVIRPVLSVLAIKFSLWLGRIVMELLGQSQTADFLKNANSCMSVGLSIIICVGIVFIVATAVTMYAAVWGG